jgi:guanylate kinase
LKRGKIIVIVAPSGTGKSTLIDKVQSEINDLKWSVSCTTRPIREGEVDGQDYFFISKDEFISRRNNNEFIEWAEVHSNFYGTLKSFVDAGLEKGDKLLFDLDVQGCDSIKSIYGNEANVIFIEPPSVDELEKRLLSRATDSIEVIKERVGNARKELLRKDDFDYNVINDDFDNAYKSLLNTIKEIIRS